MIPCLSVVFVYPTEKARNVVIKIIEETTGVVPSGKRNSNMALRAMYDVGMPRLIVNTASQAMHAKLGRHYAAQVIQVKDPMAAAMKAHGLMVRAGFHSQVVPNAETDFPTGLLVFVKAPELGGIVLAFWMENPDQSLIDQIPKGAPWTADDGKVD